MKTIKLPLLLAFLVMFSLSCAVFSQTITDRIASWGGTKGFSAEAPPYGSVKLKWEAVEGAQIYILEHRLDGVSDSFIPVMAFRGSQTNYEDFLAPKGSKLTYRLQAFKDGVPGGYKTANVTTADVIPNPLKVDATFAEDQMVTQSIGSEGGSLSLTDQNGVLFELVVPAGALQENTTLTLTPVIEIQGWPLDGPNLGAVRIGPEGLDLYDLLTLTITVPDGFPKDGTFPVGYGFDGDGDAFHVFSAGIAADGTSKQSVKSAGTQGVGTGSSFSIIEFVVDHWISQFGVNLNQLLVAQQLVDDDLAPLPTDIPASVNAIFQNADALHTQREMTNLIAQIHNEEKEETSDCESALNWYDTTSDLLSKTGDPSIVSYFQSDNTQVLLNSLNDSLNNVITTGISECEKSKDGEPPEGRDCLQRLVTQLQIDSNKSNELFTVPNGEFNPSDLQGFQETLTSCGNPGYRMPEAIALGGTTSPDPICDLTQTFSFTTNIGGVDMVMTWNPDGSYQQSISVEGCTGDFNGTYTTEVSEDGSIITLNLMVPELTVSCPEIQLTSFPIPYSPTSVELVRDPSTSCP